MRRLFLASILFGATLAVRKAQPNVFDLLGIETDHAPAAPFKAPAVGARSAIVAPPKAAVVDPARVAYEADLAKYQAAKAEYDKQIKERADAVDKLLSGRRPETFSSLLKVDKAADVIDLVRQLLGAFIAQKKADGMSVEKCLAITLDSPMPPDVVADLSGKIAAPQSTDVKDSLEQLKKEGLNQEMVALALDLTLPSVLKNPPPTAPVEPTAPAPPAAAPTKNSVSRQPRKKPRKSVRPKSVKLMKHRKVKAKPIVLKNVLNPEMRKVRPAADEGYIRHVPESDKISLTGTSKQERIAIASSLMKDPYTAVPAQRVDGLQPSMSMKSHESLFDLGVVFRAVPGGRTLATCYFPKNDGGRLRGREAMVLRWCGEVWSWLGMSLPALEAPTLRLVMQQELSCDAMTTRRWAGQQTVFNTETLWGRFLDLHLLPTLPKTAVDLAKHWNRIAILQSRPINNEFRDYIVKQYIYPELGAADEFKANAPRCLADEYLLRRAGELEGRDVLVDFPTTFDMDATYLRCIPICLAAYPVFTQVEYTGNDGERHRVKCHMNHDFVAEAG